MLIIKRLRKFGKDRPGSVAALGVFDGLHRGHMAIIRRLKVTAKRKGHDSAVVTFDPPPQLVLGKPGWPGALITLKDKETYLERAGVDVLAVIRFTPEVANLGPEEFVKMILADRLRVSHVVCGSDCGFGRGRSGNLCSLRALGLKYGFKVTEVRPIKEGGLKISSTAVKKALLRGDVALANRMLGRPYSLSGMVVRGQGLGRKLGFPTVNLEPLYGEQLVPASGVYAASALICKKVYPGLLYIGTRPTVSSRGGLSIEFHALRGCPPDRASQAEVMLLKGLRPEKRFGSLDELVRAMGRDAARALRLLGQRAKAS